MVKIRNLQVTVTYTVGLGDVEMPKEVYDQLINAMENGDALGIKDDDDDYGDAISWFADNIREGDCMECTYQIDDVIEF